MVYLARDPDEDREVAIKLVRLDAENAATARRLSKLIQIEIASSQRLNHPNIVRIFDSVIEAKRAYIVMEYVKGSSLDAYCQVNRLLPMHRVIDIIFKCCLALDHAYEHGIIHRDIKPANILLGENDTPKITDFGLSLFIQKSTERDSTFITGVGSPAYMSPEQIKGYPLDQKTDLYSIGVVLFQLLTGRLPFRAPNHAALMYKIINAETPSVTALNPNLPGQLDNILNKALEKDLYSRYQHGAEFARDLTAVRYQLVDEPTDDLAYQRRDQARFSALRKLPFFTTFENIEVWESLRFCVWREIAARVSLMTEGDEDRRFGVVVSGMVEVSTGGKVLRRLGPGEVVGEMAYLHPTKPVRTSDVITVEPTVFLEVNAAALALASEEVLERFNKVLVGVVLDRLVAANKVIAQYGESAVEANSSMRLGEVDLQLAPLDIK